MPVFFVSSCADWCTISVTFSSDTGSKQSLRSPRDSFATARSWVYCQSDRTCYRFNCNVVDCTLSYRKFRYRKYRASAFVSPKVLVSAWQSWSWVGSIHGLGWVESEFFFNFWWVGLGRVETWLRDILTSWNTLLSVNEYCSWIITFIDSWLIECRVNKLNIG